MIIEVSMIIIAVCMIVLLIVALVVGVNLQKSLRSMEFKIDNALDEMNITLSQTTTTLTSLNELTLSIKDKVEATDPIFHVISRVGSIAESFISEPRPEINLSNNINFSSPPSDGIKATDIAEWVGLGVLLWQKLTRRT